ncbi:MAG TPA: flagellar export chaperone FliS [Methylophilus sp.]|nr:flagellar export chaperone FliS [Methylophilus sp.]
MFGTTNKSVNQYKTMSIETGVAAANPVQLIVMLYEGAIVACRSAIPHIKNNDYAKKSEMIFKAIKIIQSGLRMSLDKQQGGQIAENLDALYIYMTNLLIKANIENRTELVEEVIKLLTELCSAWEEISKRELANQVRVANLDNVNNVAYLEKA